MGIASRRHVYPVLPLAILTVTVGCNDRDSTSPAASTSEAPTQHPFSIVESLRDGRKNVLAQKEHDPAVSPRIDAILSTLNHAGPEAIRRAPAVYVAAASVDGFTPGADQLWIWAVGPARPVRRVELLDETGATVLAVSERFRSIQRQDEALGITQTCINVHVIPSEWNPRPPDQATDAVKFETLGKMDPLLLPPDKAGGPLLLRIVYDGGLRSTAIPVFRGSLPPPLVAALAEVRTRAAAFPPPFGRTPDSPSPVIERVNAALAAIRHDARSPLAHPRLLSAVANEGGPALFAGTVPLSLVAVGPLTPRPSVEILDEQGTVIATYRGRAGIFYAAVDARAGTGLIEIDLNVIPSVQNPMPREKVIETARASLRMFNDDPANAAREPIELLELPPDWHNLRLSVRLAFGDNTRTDAVPIRQESRPSLLLGR
jgi:hypothetical protein